MGILDHHAEQLASLAARDRRRALIPREGRDFASNDYLSLASSPELADAASEAIDRGVPTGSGGSRLLRGNHPEHEALEAEAAAHFGSQAALFFSSGYSANATLFSTLPQRRDLIVHDRLIHASAHEGMRLGFAERVAATHNDPAAFADAIAAWRRKGGKGRVWIAVESPDREEAFLLIDEAHATGAFGAGGRGLAAHLEGRDNVVTLRTLGKALGCEGALVCGSTVLIDFLVNRGRGFIFSTAPSPLMAAVARASITLVAGDASRQERLQRLIAGAGAIFSQKLGVAPTGTQIVPVILDDDARTMAVATALQAQGFDVRGIRPPTVPEGTSRLRVSLTLNVSEADVTELADAICAAL
jgi:8-amino-7-oxononanoate synthase